MLYLLALYVAGCSSIGCLIAHGHFNFFAVIGFAILGVVSLQIGYLGTLFVENY
jgi:hypothetical protein